MRSFPPRFTRPALCTMEGSGASARKVAEESIELVEVCSRSDPDRKAIMHELADVVLAAAVVAHHHGFTVEEAIRAKCELDTGREARRSVRP